MEVERVQAIASLSAAANDIPAEFVRPEHEQPGFTTYRGPAPEIPVVDLAGEADRGRWRAGSRRRPGSGGSSRWSTTASRRKWCASCSGWGRPSSSCHRRRRRSTRASQGVRRATAPSCRRIWRGRRRGLTSSSTTSGRPPRSITPSGQRSLQNTGIHLALKIKKKPEKKMASTVLLPVHNRKANEEYRKYLGILVNKILIMLSKGLGLEDHVLMQSVGGQNLEYLLKINYYPPCPRPDLALGVVSHTDMSAITILVPNDVPGLQVFKDDQWFDVKHIPNAIIVHIGDQIEILSNGYYKSVLHRTTVNKEKARMSWPVFCSPPPEMEIGPLPQLVSDETPTKYKTKMYKDYAYCKLNKLPQ
ncbi:hypothetical protein ZIOFF_026516 [Zingiber officinale]|uniref:Fe2OG dioxygenase domain-containing protein n=1 Tax=Zingiber officinale TaxID=94328 RepID=A0A8J5GWH0_ZINOF|nr:hypothetical protein ZIOFF_026516 [Zingiber officinale]